MVVNRYIGNYMGKSEKNETEDLWSSVSNAETLRGRLKSFAIRSFRNREVGLYECCDRLVSVTSRMHAYCVLLCGMFRLLGHSMHRASGAVRWLDVTTSTERSRALKSYKEIAELPDDSHDIYKTNFLDNYYRNRPTELDELSLFETFTQYEYKRKACSAKCKRCVVLQNGFGFLHERAHPILMKTYKFRPEGDGREKFYHQL